MSLNVCAVMVTGKPGREYLARMAIKSFQEQTWKLKRLLIVNDGVPLLTQPSPGIRELIAPPGLSLGGLRNLALDRMDPDVDRVVQWDDDDYSDPCRLTWQVGQFTKEAVATVMRYETHCNLLTGEIKVCCPSRRKVFGFAGTMMHPVPTAYRYPEKAAGEDSVFTREWRSADRLRVLINDRFPTFYIRFFHGLNTWSEQHVMGFPSGGIVLTQMQRKVVTDLRARYLASAESCSPTPAAASCTS